MLGLTMNILQYFIGIPLSLRILIIPPLLVFIFNYAIRKYGSSDLDTYGADWVLALISINLAEIIDYKNFSLYITNTSLKQNIVFYVSIIMVISFILFVAILTMESTAKSMAKSHATKINHTPTKVAISPKVKIRVLMTTCWVIVVVLTYLNYSCFVV
jgi:hypothetical protein